MTRDERWVRPERAHPDDRIERIRVDVGDRRQIVRDAGGTELIGQGARDARSQLDVVHRAERKRAGHRASGRSLQAGDVSAFLVDTHNRLGRDADGRHEALELVGVTHVAREEHDAPEAFVELAPEPVGRRLTGEPGQDAGPCEAFERVTHRAQPRTAPAVRPNAIRRCTIRKKTTTGIAVSVDAAIRPPQSVYRLVP